MREQVVDALLKIGEFAQISDVPTKTLRYYDRIGLFKPVHVDPSNDSRYYSPDQLPRITRILTLKDLGSRWSRSAGFWKTTCRCPSCAACSASRESRSRSDFMRSRTDWLASRHG